LPNLTATFQQYLTIVQAKKETNSIERALGKMNKQQSALIIPETVNFPCFDFMLYLTCEQRPANEPVIVFIQTTISKVDDHNCNYSDINQLMKCNGVAIRALDSIFNEEHKAEFELVEGNSDSTKSHRITFTNSNGKKREVYYVYASGCEKSEATSSVDKYDNVIVLSQQNLQNEWKIVF